MIDPRWLIVAGIFAAGLAAGLGLAHWHYAPRLEAAELRAETLGEDIRRQNQAIDSLKTAADDRAKRAAAAIAAANASRQQAEADAALLLAAQPAPGESRCDAASALIRRELGR